MSDIIQKYTQTWITQIWFSHQKVFEMQSYYYVSWLAQVALKKVPLTSNVSTYSNSHLLYWESTIKNRTHLSATHQRILGRSTFFNEKQVAKCNSHEIGSNTAVRLDIDDVCITTSALFFLKSKLKSTQTITLTVWSLLKSIPVCTDTAEAIESVHIYGTSALSGLNFNRENVRAFFPQGQTKLSVIMRFPY